MRDNVISAINEALNVLFGVVDDIDLNDNIIGVIDSEDEKYEFIEELDDLLDIELSSEDADEFVTFDDIVNKCLELLN